MTRPARLRYSAENIAQLEAPQDGGLPYLGGRDAGEGARGAAGGGHHDHLHRGEGGRQVQQRLLLALQRERRCGHDVAGDLRSRADILMLQVTLTEAAQSPSSACVLPAVCSSPHRFNWDSAFCLGRSAREDGIKGRTRPMSVSCRLSYQAPMGQMKYTCTDSRRDTPEGDRQKQHQQAITHQQTRRE